MLVPLVLASGAFASGRLAMGVQTGSGVNPVEPTWDHPRASPSAVVCAGVTGYWITGGHDYAGPRGEVLRTNDDKRWGAVVQACPTSGGAAQGAFGGAFGRQWGEQVYFVASSAAGLSMFTKTSDGAALQHAGHRYTSVAPYVKPAFAIGIAMPPGMSFEVGPYALLTPPIFSTADVLPAGRFYGHVGLELTVLAGAASPQVPWVH